MKKRFLSQKDKDGSTHRRDKSTVDKKTRPNSENGNWFSTMFKPESQKKETKTADNYDEKLQNIKQRLADQGRTEVEDSQIALALNSTFAKGNVDRAFRLVVIFQESVEGVVKPYDANIQMLGAANRNGATCYLDSLLFAMFARLPNFEPLLFTTFEDEPRRRLSTLIRLWVNMLRTGMLIDVDITKYLQDAIADCGWSECATDRQQDTSEAFHKISDMLGLPLLALKVNILHPGVESTEDDHKLIHERILYVSIPDPSEPGPAGETRRAVRLEECLEDHFNNRIAVIRKLQSAVPKSSCEKSSAQHVEVTEAISPAPQGPAEIEATETSFRMRSDSLFRNKVLTGEEDGEGSSDSDELYRSMSNGSISMFKGKVEREVMLPAWQCFNLLPWYTRSSATLSPNEDNRGEKRVAEHLLKTKPVLGIALKRYEVTPDGRSIRKNTLIDIPLELRLPHFIEDSMVPSQDGPLMGNFKLSLQSFVCHRGNDLSSGHYVSFVRGTTKIPDGDADSTQPSHGSLPPIYAEDRWIKFDDCGVPRVTDVPNIQQALKDEMPYLLFYQVQPTYDTYFPDGLHEVSMPPSYTDSGVDVRVSASSPSASNERANARGYFDGIDDSPPIIRYSPDEPPRQSLNLPEERRGSVAVTEGSTTSIASIGKSEADSSPITPAEETTGQRVSRTLRRNKGARSRPPSSSGDNRIAQAFKTLMSRNSKEFQFGDRSTLTLASRDTASGLDGSNHAENSNGDSSKQASATVSRKGSKKNKKRAQSRGPAEVESLVSINGGNDHNGNLKDQERVCKIM